MCRRKKEQGQYKCWDNTDLRAHSATCDNGSNCQQYQDGGVWKDLVCVKRYDSSKKKCWKDTTTDLQGHGQRCDNDSQCGGTLTCYKASKKDKNRCW